MDIEQVALLAGILFILIAIVGGGITIRELRIPRVPGWARAGSLVIGLAFVFPFFRTALDGTDGGDHGRPDPEAPVRLHTDDDPAPSRHGLELTHLAAEAARQPVRVGDAVTVRFRLKNAGAEEITFEETFVAARDPTDGWADFGGSNEGLTLHAGQNATVKAQKTVDSPGNWRFWPCYIVANGSDDEEAYCPGRWRAFVVRVLE